MYKYLEWRRQIFTCNHRIYYNSLIKITIVGILLLFIALCTITKPLYEVMLKDKSGNVSKNSGVLTYETKHLKKEYGESQRKEGHYAAVDISYPVVTAGNNACKNSVNTYIQNYLIQKLRDYLPRNTAEENDIGTLAQSFLNGYKAFVKEFPESHQRWFITINGEVIYNTPAITTLTLSINTYTGGAHGNSGLTYVSFDAATGEKITLTNIITDEKKLVERSEKKLCY